MLQPAALCCCHKTHSISRGPRNKSRRAPHHCPESSRPMVRDPTCKGSGHWQRPRASGPGGRGSRTVAAGMQPDMWGHTLGHSNSSVLAAKGPRVSAAKTVKQQRWVLQQKKRSNRQTPSETRPLHHHPAQPADSPQAHTQHTTSCGTNRTKHTQPALAALPHRSTKR